jgi:hypothetical protein
MTADARAAVLTARRAAQHFRLSVPPDAYEYLCILTILPVPRPVSALCWQIHRCLAVSVPLLRVWVHCPRASNGPLPRRSYLVGYAQWDARFNQCLLVKQSVPATFQVAACDGTHGLIEFLLSRQSFSAAFQLALRVADHTRHVSADSPSSRPARRSTLRGHLTRPSRSAKTLEAELKSMPWGFTATVAQFGDCLAKACIF